MKKHAMLIMAAAGMTFCAAAAEPPQWQIQSAGPRFRIVLKSMISRGTLALDETRSAGLCLQILDWNAQWPKLIADWREYRPSSQLIEGGFANGVNVDVKGTTFTLMDLGFISTAPEGTEAELADITQDWTTVELKYEVPPDGLPKDTASEFALLEAGELGLSVRVSRLSPAILLESASPMLHFFRGQPKGKLREPEFFFAAGMPNSKSLKASDGGMTASGAEFELPRSGWLLCWGSALQPLLFVFEHPPAQLTASPGLGLTFHFESEAGRVAVMPLLGDKRAETAELAKWGEGTVPKQMRESCEFWAGALRQYPVRAVETWAWDKAKDKIQVSGEVEFIAIGDSTQAGYAPLPPAVVLALEAGFPIELDGPVKQTGLATMFGPLWLCSGPRYKYTVRDLKKYWEYRRHFKDPSGAEPAVLHKRLGRELGKILEAGHLAPVRFVDRGNAGISIIPPRLTWSNPAENLLLLAGLLPALSPEMLEKALDYIRKERQQYPPESVAVLGFYEGSRREVHPIENNRAWQPSVDSISVDEQMKKESFHLLNKVPPLLSLYALAEYNAAAGAAAPDVTPAQARELLEPWLRHSDWATGGFMRWQRTEFGASTSENNMSCTRVDLWDGMGGVVDANAFLAAAIGYARLARMCADSEAEAEAAYLFAKAAIFRFFLGKYNEYCWRNGLARAGETYGDGQQGYFFRSIAVPPEQDYNLVHEFSQFGPGFATYIAGIGLLSNYIYLVPETGRFLKDWLPSECLANDRRLENTFWYAASTTAEDGRPYPEPVYGLFLGKAWVTGAVPKDLTIYCDAPAVARGDLYYMHKLAEAILASRGWEWK